MKPDEFKTARQRLDWTQSRLAQVLGLTRETVNRYESGKLPIPQIVENFMGELTK